MSWENTSRMQKFILKEKPSARNCCMRKVDKNHKRLPAEERDHLVLPGTGPNGYYRNHHTDLVICTNKGILIVPVEFNEQFWLQILDKLHLFL